MKTFPLKSLLIFYMFTNLHNRANKSSQQQKSKHYLIFSCDFNVYDVYEVRGKVELFPTQSCFIFLNKILNKMLGSERLQQQQTDDNE